MRVEDFEVEWAQAVADYGLQDALWWNQVYGKKEMWANAFLCEKFCAGYRTTSRCEGINSVCKIFLESKHSMLELVQNLELPVRVYRNNELLAQFREIESVSSVNFVGVRRSLTTKVHTVEEYGYPGRHIIVLCDKNMGKLECHCNFWKIQGFSCKYIFFVMKYEHMLTIPSNLVLKRWTKEAKSLEAYVKKTDDGGNRVFLLRHGALHSVSRWLFFLGAQQVGLFAVALEGIRRLCATLESELAKGLQSRNSKACGEVRDPIVVRTKGAPRRHKRNASKRKCSKCNKSGHTKRTCIDGRPRRGKRARLDTLDSDEDEGQSEEVAELDMTGSNDQTIRIEEVFGGGSLCMSQVLELFHNLSKLV
ncbi:protein FAR1-RELATED SEQUENCE 5-like [Arachis stenosperma]|uniref:protein FAR1-RELATED SEQUENCE 5-like n=1 Tax=Arachis stenosperma TaxID=217475 RepID=UPI0025AC5E3C|nr:protein FAR1-RELATED SEQUENCE 5-like [Arachis stenosperma]